MVIEAPTPGEEQLLRDVLALAEEQQIGTGGGQRRGHGWVRWTTVEQGDADAK
jgi:hypothetical protein